MNNIFENAYFGKAYKTRDGRKAIYIKFVNTYTPHHKLIINNEKIISYDIIGNAFNGHKELDIISEWQPEISKEELDELAIEKACEFADTYQEKTGNYGHNEDTLAVGYRYGYYDGYRKALKL